MRVRRVVLHEGVKRRAVRPSIVGLWCRHSLSQPLLIVEVDLILEVGVLLKKEDDLLLMQPLLLCGHMNNYTKYYQSMRARV